jgi:hypothetical protein
MSKTIYHTKSVQYRIGKELHKKNIKRLTSERMKIKQCAIQNRQGATQKEYKKANERTHKVRVEKDNRYV